MIKSSKLYQRSQTNIEEEIKDNPELNELLITILSPSFQLYDISRTEIKFSSRALLKTLDYLEKTFK